MADEVNESAIERHFKLLLEGRGFKVVKLVTPGTAGVPDRLILRPRYWPGPPMMVEFKKPKEPLRKLQAAVALDYQARGVHVLPYIDSRERATEVANWLMDKSREAYALATTEQIFDDPILRALPKE